MSRASQRLTACILTYNEEAHIVDCINSLQWADRIFVFDSISEDNTLTLAHQAGAFVAQHPFKNYAEQRNAALAQMDTDWVFFVDADERGSHELGEEIRSVINERPEHGWLVPRHNYIFGKLTLGAGWFPDYQARLFKFGSVRYDRPVHEIAEVDGATGYLKTPLIHHNYDNVAQFHKKQRAYTEYETQILRTTMERPKLYTPYTQAVRHFWWRFVTHEGYKDGLHGLQLSRYMAYYEWLKYRRLRRMAD